MSHPLAPRESYPVCRLKYSYTCVRVLQQQQQHPLSDSWSYRMSYDQKPSQSKTKADVPFYCIPAIKLLKCSLNLLHFASEIHSFENVQHIWNEHCTVILKLKTTYEYQLWGFLFITVSCQVSTFCSMQVSRIVLTSWCEPLSVFTARCTLVQSTVLRSHVVCLSVRLWRWWIRTK